MTKPAKRRNKHGWLRHESLTWAAILGVVVSAAIGAIVGRVVDAVPLKILLVVTSCILVLILLIFVWRRTHWRWAIGGLIVVVTLVAIALFARPLSIGDNPTTSSDDRTIILVADFVGPDSLRYGVTETVLGNLRTILRPYKDIEVIALGQPITEQNSNAARIEGQKRNAAFVIWGRYSPTRTHVGLAVHFLILKPPPVLPRLSLPVEGQLQTALISSLEDFSLQTRLSKQMGYLSLFVAGMAHYDRADWASAEKYFKDALQQVVTGVPKTDESLVYFYLGNTRWFQDDFEKAKAYFSKSIKLDPTSFDAYINRAVVSKELDDKIADCNKAIALNPRVPTCYATRGMAQFSKGEVGKAVTDLNTAIRLEPNFAAAYTNRALINLTTGEINAAISDANRAIELAPDHPLAYLHRARAYEESGNFERALVDFNKAIQLAPDYSTAYQNRGTAYYSKMLFDRAIPDFTQSLKLEPNDVLVYQQRGISYYYIDKYDLAINDFNKAIQLKPNSSTTYLARALTYVAIGEADKAIADFRRVLRLTKDPQEKRNAEAQLAKLERAKSQTGHP
jgi:tetratricopeptide (TPR) repeat protein